MADRQRLHLSTITYLGAAPPPTNQRPILGILYRLQSSADSPGCWMSYLGDGYGVCAPDRRIGWWMPIAEFDALHDSAPTWRTMPTDRPAATFRRDGWYFDSDVSWRTPEGVTGLVMINQSPKSVTWLDGKGGMAQHDIPMRWADLGDFLPSMGGGQ